MIDPALITSAYSLGIPVFELDAYDIHTFPHGVINEALIRTYHVLPVTKQEKRLTLAVTHPTQQSGLSEIKFHTGLSIYPVLVEEEKLKSCIEEIFTTQAMANLEAIEIEMSETQVNNATEDAPIVRFINKILQTAISKGASDVHFEPYETYY